ncbi:winged helix DNA-binding protein [Methylovirgula sp. 4M-Z18]|uniref:winged helix DNA-binding protein n=1 Tax=Methylovirgula sp. 4M-Z18 TaxID=2293567 RepID=UPI000E2ED134|nr:winged helix DNA-binding protein [Methylovirgula sp. 4M-Z18]RFB78815.1 transcriptional regulator [Methylovirgula sp. 4M-Z18]
MTTPGKPRPKPSVLPGFGGDDAPPQPRGFGPIVASAHLASGASPALSELEFGLMLASHAFHRWMVRGMAAAGLPDLSPLDVMVLHTVNHRGRAKKLADICLVLNIEDTHLVNYALKKLERLGLVKSQKAGKEKAVTISPKGEQACLKYREIREALLVKAVQSVGLNEAAISQVAAMLRGLSGHYDQAARAAASL